VFPFILISNFGVSFLAKLLFSFLRNGKSFQLFEKWIFPYSFALECEIILRLREIVQEEYLFV